MRENNSLAHSSNSSLPWNCTYVWAKLTKKGSALCRSRAILPRSESQPSGRIIWLAPSTNGEIVKRLIGIILTALPLLGGSPAANAQATQRIAIEIIDQSDGSVGGRLVYFVKEGFRRSVEYRLTDDRNEMRWQIIISTMPRFSDTPNSATMYAVVWTFVYREGGGPWHYEYYNNTIGYAGTDVVQSAAEGIVSSTDRMISSLRRQVQ